MQTSFYRRVTSLKSREKKAIDFCDFAESRKIMFIECHNRIRYPCIYHARWAIWMCVLCRHVGTCECMFVGIYVCACVCLSNGATRCVTSRYGVGCNIIHKCGGLCTLHKHNTYQPRARDTAPWKCPQYRQHCDNAQERGT